MYINRLSGDREIVSNCCACFSLGLLVSFFQRSNKCILTNRHSTGDREIIWKSELINLGSNEKRFSPSLAEFNDPMQWFRYNRTRERNNRVRSFLSLLPNPNEWLRARFFSRMEFEKRAAFHPLSIRSIRIIGGRECAAIPTFGIPYSRNF